MKKSLGKWVILDKDLGSRMICEFENVHAEIDGMSCYSIGE